MPGGEAGWLIDKSALVKLGRSPDVDLWANRIERGLVRVSTLTVLEMGFSARSGKNLRMELGRPPIASLPREYITPKIEDRAVEVLVKLADRGCGQHRAPSIPDLIIAASAEAAGITVLHDDKDYELIATMTGQRVERLQL